MTDIVKAVLNSVVNTVSSKGQVMEDMLPKVDAMLDKFLKKQVGKFKELLKETGALLAGGSLVTAYLGLDPSDLDIYVPITNIKRFNQEINKILENKDLVHSNSESNNDFNKNNIVIQSYESSFYCKSFLRRNGIRCVYRHSEQIKVRGIRHTTPLIDVMAVRKSRKPIDVVTNFDLTFCQVWYDGSAVYATHPDHLRNRYGILQGDYVMLYFQDNYFLKRRCNKYTQYPRSFKIDLDPEIVKGLKLQMILDNDINIATYKKQEHTDAYWIRWATRNIMRYILTGKFIFKSKGLLISEADDASYYQDNIIKNDYVEKLEGYDSEDYNEPDFTKLVSLAKEKGGHLYLYAHNLLWELCETMYKEGFPYVNTQTTGLIGENFIEHKNKYKELVSHIGNCIIMATDDEPVWYFHQHKEDEGISIDGLIGYMNEHMKDVDKTELPCFIPGCSEKFTEKHLRCLVPKEFWEKFKIPGDVDLKVPTDMFEAVVKNEKTWATTERPFGKTIREIKKVRDGWGPLYHHAICPYCLAPEYRRDGCMYLHHTAPGSTDTLEKRLPSPFCQKHNVIPELREKYFKAWRNKYPSGYYLEFCSTCGRPSAGHRHFDLSDDPDFIEYEGGPDDHPMEGAYTKCMGGGRPEMIARLLAMKKVIEENKENEISDYNLRKACALAADIAPRDEALMAKARAIFAKERRKRGTYETFNTADITNLPENDVEKTIEQMEDVVNLEPEDVPAYEAIVAIREQEQQDALAAQQAQRAPPALQIPPMPEEELNDEPDLEDDE